MSTSLISSNAIKPIHHSLQVVTSTGHRCRLCRVMEQSAPHSKTRKWTGRKGGEMGSFTPSQFSESRHLWNSVGVNYDNTFHRFWYGININCMPFLPCFSTSQTSRMHWYIIPAVFCYISQSAIIVKYINIGLCFTSFWLNFHYSCTKLAQKSLCLHPDIEPLLIDKWLHCHG